MTTLPDQITIVSTPFPLERTSLPSIYETWVTDPETTLRKDIEAIFSGLTAGDVASVSVRVTMRADKRITEIESQSNAESPEMIPVKACGFMTVLAENRTIDEMEPAERFAIAMDECVDFETLLWIKALVTNIGAILSQTRGYGKSICIYTDTVGVIVGRSHTQESDYFSVNSRSERIRHSFSKKVRGDL